MEQKPNNEQMEELIKDGRQADREDKEFADAMKGLMAHPGWKLYEEKLAAMVQVRGDEMLKPLPNLDAALAQEHVKGTMFGLMLAKSLPSVTIQSMKNSQPANDEEE